ncbi:hypothetical protein NHH03_00480, partial [Stieleria sp. TO1_6]|uniref:hypothetical protein n=1 Tax=Stieleria tagensis TaxID=2956795 RepID=UPI00209AE859
DRSHFVIRLNSHRFTSRLHVPEYMSEHIPERTYAEIEAEQFRKELPGTIGCVAAYTFVSLIACGLYIPAPYDMIAAAGLVLLYIGAIVIFGQGSILEMGVMAVILLILSCQIGSIASKDKADTETKPIPIQNGG